MTTVSPFDQNGKVVTREIAGAYTIVPPYIINPTPPMPTGLDPAIMEVLSIHLKFRITYKFAPNFNELFKLVLMGQADMALSQPNFIYQRYRLGLDMSPGLTLRSIFFIKRRPVPVDSMYTVFYPFTNTVWLSIFVTIALIACVLTLFNRYTVSFSLQTSC